MRNRAVFLDRDGVLVEDVGPITHPDQFSILDGAPSALKRLQSNGFSLIVVTNQTVISRGLLTPADVDDLHDILSRRFEAQGVNLDRFYVCPHHPNATNPAFRTVCECRKPMPGLLLRAARDLDIDLAASFMIGDRISDIAAGSAAGVTTIQLATGRHVDPKIESDNWPEPEPLPDHLCANLAEAADWILGVEA